MVLKLPWAQKRILWAFEKVIFQFFANLWVTKLKPFSRRVKQSVQNYLNQNLVIGSFVEKGFEATLSSKINALSIWKGHFSVFRKFLSDEVESLFWELVIGSFLENGFIGNLSSKTNIRSIWKEQFSVFCKSFSDKVEIIFWESEAKRSKLFKSKFGHSKLCKKWFWSHHKLKNECSEHLKRSFFSFA